LRTENQILAEAFLSTGKRVRIVFMCLLLLVILFLLLDILFGSVSIKASDVFKVLFQSTESPLKTIIFDFRIPKAFTALTVGIALSLSGLQMQTLFRNPMAGPDVLGISSGASLGSICYSWIFRKHVS
jgi:iron complex transport system permease protein